MNVCANRIRVEMARQRLTFSQVAERGGVSRQGLYLVLRRGSCSPVTAGRIADGLGIPVEQLLGGEGVVWR